MNLIETTMLYFSFAVSVLFLVAGGWVKVRDYFKAKAAAKAEAAEKAAKEAEEAIQARIAAAVAESKSTAV